MADLKLWVKEPMYTVKDIISHSLVLRVLVLVLIDPHDEWTFLEAIGWLHDVGLKDPRIVVLSSEDDIESWEARVNGGSCFWADGESVVESKLEKQSRLQSEEQYSEALFLL